MSINSTALVLEVHAHGSLNGSAKATVSATFQGQLIHEDKLDLASATRREQFGRAVASRINKPDEAGTISQQLLAELEHLRREVREEKPVEEGGVPDPVALLDETPIEIREEAEHVLSSPNLLTRISDDIQDMGVAGERKLAMTTYTVLTSRMLHRPVSIIIQGLSSSGKSFVLETAADLMPDEGKIIATQMTPQSLVHMKPGSLRHRAVIAGERSRGENDETAEGTRLLREMISSRKISKLMPTKMDGEIVTVLIEQEGPIAFAETTTLTNIFEEDLNRCILANTDETPEQTKRILATVASNRTKSAAFLARRQHIMAVHHAIQRLLACSPAVVSIPYAERLADLFPHGRTGARRAFGHLLNFIEACALVHRRQRPQLDDGTILASAEDYRIARFLLLDPIQRAIGGGLSDGAKRFRDRLYGWASRGVFTTSESVHHEPGLSDRAVRGYLRELSHAGWVDCLEEGRGAKPSKWRVPEKTPDEADRLGLPTVDEVCGGLSELPEIKATSDANIEDATF